MRLKSFPIVGDGAQYRSSFLLPHANLSAVFSPEATGADRENIVSVSVHPAAIGLQCAANRERILSKRTIGAPVYRRSDSRMFCQVESSRLSGKPRTGPKEAGCVLSSSFLGRLVGNRQCTRLSAARGAHRGLQFEGLCLVCGRTRSCGHCCGFLCLEVKMKQLRARRSSLQRRKSWAKVSYAIYSSTEAIWMVRGSQSCMNRGRGSRLASNKTC